MTMTYNECYNYAVSEFLKSENSDAVFDAYCLIDFVFGFDKSKLILHGDESAPETQTDDLKRMVSMRVSGMPVQYIIGEWDFFNDTFYVGEGVLIPRPETEMLVEEALEYLKGRERLDTDSSKPVVFDLCAGSGCIGISIANAFPDSLVYAFEKSTDALPYLRKNITRNTSGNVVCVHSDVLTGTVYDSNGVSVPILADLIVSNPPYIKSDEITGLQKEVQREPLMALDGGDDGLVFYRAIAKDWMPRIKSGGLLLVECGEDQADDIASLFSDFGAETFKIRDFAGIFRMVGAKKP